MNANNFAGFTLPSRRTLHNKGINSDSDSDNSEIVVENSVSNSDSDCQIKVFDLLSERIAYDTVLSLPIKEWETKPATVYFWCNSLGPDRVRAHILETRNKAGLRNRGAWLNRVLMNLIASEQDGA